MNKLEKLNKLHNAFYLYLNEWEKLDKFKLNWWFKYPLFPVGFILTELNLRKKHALTTSYKKYLDKIKIK